MSSLKARNGQAGSWHAAALVGWWRERQLASHTPLASPLSLLSLPRHPRAGPADPFTAPVSTYTITATTTTTTPQALAVFSRADADGSGQVDRAECPALLKELNLRLSDELYARYVEAFFKEADLDSSNAISADEFLLMFDKVFAPSRLYGAELRRAAGRGEVDKVRELVARGCNPNSGDGKGWR